MRTSNCKYLDRNREAYWPQKNTIAQQGRRQETYNYQTQELTMFRNLKLSWGMASKFFWLNIPTIKIFEHIPPIYVYSLIKHIFDVYYKTYTKTEIKRLKYRFNILTI